MNPRIKREKRIRRHKRVRAKIYGTAERPRLSVFRSSKNIFLQLIDDTAGATLVSASSKDAKGKLTKQEAARETARILGEKAKKAGIKEVVFDRGGFAYHGRVKVVAEAVREAGINI